MLSSNLFNFLAMASFALTTTAAAALKPRAAGSNKNNNNNNNNNNNKVCSNTFYSAPQCCIPQESADSALDTPDCITREFPLSSNFLFAFPSLSSTVQFPYSMKSLIAD
jgi:hypothetical protein